MVQKHQSQKVSKKKEEMNDDIKGKNLPDSNLRLNDNVYDNKQNDNQNDTIRKANNDENRTKTCGKSIRFPKIWHML